VIYCFDIDNTICRTTGTTYTESTPIINRIAAINFLYKEGHTIKIFTGRGSRSGKDWREFTENQLKEWGVKYHELIMGKPHADFFIDDRAVHPEDFWGQFD
jgi:hypothetical protein